MHNLIRFLHEVGHLAHTQRSGLTFLGTGDQSVAEHSYRTALIGWVLSHRIEAPVDTNKAVLLCLFHDLPETRTGDINYVQKKYLKVDTEKVLQEMGEYPFFSELFSPYLTEYEENKTIEAQIAHDADQLELLLELKKLLDLGNKFATDWMDRVEKRLTLDESKEMASTIRKEDYNMWWETIQYDPSEEPL